MHWAEFSGVEATLSLVQQALNRPETYDYCVLLQGSDYPLRSGKYVEAFFEASYGAEFMNIVKMPNDRAGKPISRINKLWIPSASAARQLGVRMLGRLGLAERDYRKHLGNMEPYAGSACWALSTEACRHILDFIERNRHVEKYFHTTRAPDEMFFQTILGNSMYASRIRRNLHYEDWSDKGRHPAMIEDRHAALFEEHETVRCNDVYGSGEALFARKFSDDNLEVVERIDRMIKRKEVDTAAAPGQ